MMCKKYLASTVRVLGDQRLEHADVGLVAGVECFVGEEEDGVAQMDVEFPVRCLAWLMAEAVLTQDVKQGRATMPLPVPSPPFITTATSPCWPGN
jgi:hypothetical protein